MLKALGFNSLKNTALSSDWVQIDSTCASPIEWNEHVYPHPSSAPEVTSSNVSSRDGAGQAEQAGAKVGGGAGGAAAAGQPPWDALPEECVEQILLNAGFQSALKATLACKAWHRVTSSRSFWRKMFVSHFGQNEARLEARRLAERRGGVVQARP